MDYRSMMGGGGRVPTAGNTGTDIGAAGHGLSAGIIQGMILRRQMEMQDKEVKGQEKAAKDKAAMDEQKMQMQYMQAFLDKQASDRKATESNFKVETLWPSQVEQNESATDLATVKADNSNLTRMASEMRARAADRKANSGIDLDTKQGELAEARTAEIRSRPDLMTKKFVESGLAEAAASSKHARDKELETHKSDLEKTVSGEKSTKNKRAATVKAVQGYISKVRSGADVVPDSEVTAAVISMIQVAGFNYEIDGASGSVRIVDPGEPPGLQFTTDPDNLAEGTKKTTPEGAVYWMKDGEWKLEQEG